MEKIGNICKFMPKSKRNAKFSKNEGKYNFYTSSDKIKKCDIADYNHECIIIGTGGNSSIHYINEKFSCSTDNLIITFNDNTIYYYYILKSLWNEFKNNMHGSTIKHVTKSMLENFEIPVPKSKSKSKIIEWINKLNKPYKKILNNRKNLKKLHDKVNYKINKILEENDIEEIILEDMCNYIKSGKDMKYFNNGDYIYYNASGIKGKVNEGFENNNNYILCSRVGTIGNFYKPFHMFNASSNVIIINLKEEYKKFYNYLFEILINKNYKDITKGSIQKLITSKDMKLVKIEIPKNKQIIEQIDPIFEKINEINKEIPEQEKTYQHYIEELKKESIKN
jgi:type I restriction enzyme S subunit